MAAALLQAVRRRARPVLADERGVALVLSIIMVSALSLATVGLVQLVTSNTKAYGRDKQSARAFNVAEAGLSYGISRLTQYDSTGSLPTGSVIGSSTTPQTFTLDGGSGNGTWWATKTSANTWAVNARALSPNGTVQRHVAVDTTVGISVATTEPSPVWGYGFFVAGGTGCTNMAGKGSETLPVWIGGDLCLASSNTIAEPNASGPKSVTLYVGGKLTFGGAAMVGSSTRPIQSATVVGGCYTSGTPQICSNSPYSKVWADSYSSTPSTLTKPTLDAAGTYASGKWHQPVCTSGTGYVPFVFDTNGTRDMSRGTIGQPQLLPLAANYDCTVYDPTDTAVVGRLAWDYATKTMTIDGVIYIDGGLGLGGGDYISYVGSGTIYMNGIIKVASDSTICGPGSVRSGFTCTGTWDPSLGKLFFVSVNAANGNTSFEMAGKGEYHIGVYVNGHFKFASDAGISGPVVADTASIGGAAEATLVAQPPPGVPGAVTTATTTKWSVIKGTWRQIPAG